jgi:hypothetical protein
MEDIIAISALNQFVFCPRRCALMHVEGISPFSFHFICASAEVWIETNIAYNFRPRLLISSLLRRR